MSGWGPGPYTGAQGAVGAQGVAAPGQGPTLNDLAKAMEESRRKQAQSAAMADTYESKVDALGKMGRTKDHSMFSALAAGIRGYATRKAMDKRTEALAQSQQAAAAADLQELAYERQSAAEKLAEQRQYDQAQELEDRAYEEQQKLADQEREAKLLAEKRNYESMDKQDERIEAARVQEKMSQGMSRDQAYLAIHKEDIANKQRTSSLTGTGQEIGKVAQNDIEKHQTMLARGLDNLKIAQETFKPEYIGLMADMKKGVGEWSDYIGIDTEMTGFAADRQKYMTNMYNYINQELLRRSGAAVTQTEMDRFVKEIPVDQMGKGPEVFKAALDATIDNIGRDMAINAAIKKGEDPAWAATQYAIKRERDAAVMVEMAAKDKKAQLEQKQQIDELKRAALTASPEEQAAIYDQIWDLEQGN